MSKSNGLNVVLFISITFLIGFFLTALPLPSWANYWRPSWVAILLIYWSINRGEYVGIFVAWFVGVLVDALLGTVLGQHGLGFAVIVAVTCSLRANIVFFPPLQQTATVFCLLIALQIILSWINAWIGTPVVFWQYMLSPLISALLWPWIVIVLDDTQHKYSLT